MMRSRPTCSRKCTDYSLTMMQEKYSTAISDFTTTLYHKGYRGKFTMDHPGSSTPRTLGSLRHCLEKFLMGYENTAATKPAFKLETYADNGHLKRCIFNIELDTVKGFLVRDMLVKEVVTNMQKYYEFVNNHQIPGSAAVQALFPKPKPWDHIIKGRFRP